MSSARVTWATAWHGACRLFVARLGTRFNLAPAGLFCVLSNPYVGRWGRSELNVENAYENDLAFPHPHGRWGQHARKCGCSSRPTSTETFRLAGFWRLISPSFAALVGRPYYQGDGDSFRPTGRNARGTGQETPPPDVLRTQNRKKRRHRRPHRLMHGGVSSGN